MALGFVPALHMVLERIESSTRLNGMKKDRPYREAVP